MEGESHLGCAHRDIEFQNISLLQKIKVETRRKISVLLCWFFWKFCLCVT